MTVIAGKHLLWDESEGIHRCISTTTRRTTNLWFCLAICLPEMASAELITGAQWLCEEFYLLLSEKPVLFADVLHRNAVLLSGDLVGHVVRQMIVREQWRRIFLRVFALSQRFELFVRELCAEHGYVMQGPVSQLGKLDQVRLSRGGVVFEVCRVTVSLGEPNPEQLAILFVCEVMGSEASRDGALAIHLMSDWVAVCLPIPDHDAVSESGFLPVSGSGCVDCGQHTPRVFPLRREAEVTTEDELRGQQKEWLERGRVLEPPPAEAWFLRSGLLDLVFSMVKGI